MRLDAAFYLGVGIAAVRSADSTPPASPVSSPAASCLPGLCLTDCVFSSSSLSLSGSGSSLYRRRRLPPLRQLRWWLRLALFLLLPMGVAQAAVDGGEVAKSVESSTTDVPGQGALPTAPALPTAATPVPPPPVLAGPAPAPPVAAPPAQRGPSLGRRQQRPHSPAPRDERETSRRRHDSPRRRGSQANWAAPRGGRGGWWGQRHHGGGWAHDQPVTMANLQRAVSAAVREERIGQASQSHSPRVAPTPAAPPPVALPVPAAPPPRVAAPLPPAPSASAAAPASREEPLWFPSAGDALSFQALARPPRMAEVPEVSLGQLWRLAEALRAVHLVQAYGHAALARGGSLDGRQWDECLDAADRLAELLAPVLAAPAMGVIAGVGQLGTAVRGLRRILRAGSGADGIGASTAAVRELHRSLTALLAVLDADQY
ncbi:unnamed protein product [Closterium sp. Naga37s-1]|nr:unnamed protein product [Closterium sp. Naga37s-1]